jgi:hypothetical protein
MKNKHFIASWDDVPLIMDLVLAGRVVGQSPEHLKKRAQRGDFPAFKEGGEWRITKDALMRHCGVVG